MSRKIEYFDAAGLRRDGRRANELRDISIIVGSGVGNKSPLILGTPSHEEEEQDKHLSDDDAATSSLQQQKEQQRTNGASSSAAMMSSSSIGMADGSAEIVSATSHVRALVFGPKQAQLRHARPDAAHLSCEVTALRRRGGGTARRARSQELSSLVVDSISPVMLLSQYPMSTIHIHVDVLLSDGDEEVMCINAAGLALADACIAMRDVVVAAQVCFLDGKHIVVDPTFEELRSGCPHWIEAVFAHRPGQMAMLHEEGRYRKEQEEDVKDGLHASCFQACASTGKKVLEAVREHTNSQLAVLEG